MTTEKNADAPAVFDEKTGSTAALGQDRPIASRALPELVDEAAEVDWVAVPSNN